MLYPTKSLGKLLRQAKTLTSLSRVELTLGRWNSCVQPSCLWEDRSVFPRTIFNSKRITFTHFIYSKVKIQRTIPATTNNDSFYMKCKHKVLIQIKNYIRGEYKDKGNWNAYMVIYINSWNKPALPYWQQTHMLSHNPRFLPITNLSIS